MKLLSKGPSINSLIKRYVSAREVKVWFSTVQYGAKGVRGLKVSRVPELKRCQRTKGAKGQKLRRSTRGQGLLKNSSQIELDS